MSQYLYFFARHDKEFILIADYSRSTQVYSEVNAPYEKIRKIDETELRSVAERLRAGKNFAKSQIEALNRCQNLLTGINQFNWLISPVCGEKRKQLLNERHSESAEQE